MSDETDSSEVVVVPEFIIIVSGAGSETSYADSVVLTKNRSETLPLSGMPYLLRSKNYFSLLDDLLIDAEWTAHYERAVKVYQDWKESQRTD